MMLLSAFSSGVAHPAIFSVVAALQSACDGSPEPTHAAEMFVEATTGEWLYKCSTPGPVRHAVLGLGGGGEVAVLWRRWLW